MYVEDCVHEHHPSIHNDDQCLAQYFTRVGLAG